MKETGILVAKELSTGIGLAYEDYSIRTLDDVFQIKTSTALLGPKGGNLDLSASFDRKWNFISGIISSQGKMLHQTKIEGNKATLSSYNLEENETTIKIQSGTWPIVIYSGTLLMPFLWIKKLLFGNENKELSNIRIIPEGTLKLERLTSNAFKSTYSFQNENVDFEIEYEPSDGKLVKCKSRIGNLLIEYAE